ncbi:hypothetical protein L6452_40713 [Arctium lappa]|uniref:Uncharacterized protein n=1 Tax=Arctium lappa TaxID=4217 RepID=A0ACB8XN76_ARCLA|nr:hypothetical protein L6452_40713 [Arctium lappa]
MKTVLFFMFSLILYSNFAFGQSVKLDDKEVKVLKELGENLGLAGKKEWDLDKDPCSGKGNCGRGEYRKGFEVWFKAVSTCLVLDRFGFHGFGQIWLKAITLDMLVLTDLCNTDLNKLVLDSAYFRGPIGAEQWCGMWPDLIQKAKEGGLDVIQTCVFWNGHEPQPAEDGEEDNSSRGSKPKKSEMVMMHSYWLTNFPRDLMAGAMIGGMVNTGISYLVEICAWN